MNMGMINRQDWDSKLRTLNDGSFDLQAILSFVWQHDSSLTDHDPQVDETAPSNFPLWARWLCLLTFWPGVIWYLYYKLLVED